MPLGLRAASTYLGVKGTALRHQFLHLERDLDAPLYQPYAAPNPQRPTPLGQTLLDELSTDLVRTRMVAAIGSNRCPAMPDPRRHTHQRPFDDLTVAPLSTKRGRTTLLRYLADHGPDTDFNASAVVHATGGKSSTVHRLLKQMAAADWLTRRLETENEQITRARTAPDARRRVYYRFTPTGTALSSVARSQRKTAAGDALTAFTPSLKDTT